MKKLFYFIIALFITILGCSENGEMVSSYNPDSQITQNGPNWLTFPAHKNSKLTKINSASTFIDGAVGGTLTITDEYLTESNTIVTVEADIVFYPGAFTGTKNIEMVIDDYECTVQFSPAAVFSSPAIFNMRIGGLDLSNVNPNDVDFVYCPDVGDTENVDYEALQVDIIDGDLVITNAQLNHFSRYGWVN